MLNREKYAEEILNIACDGGNIALINGKLENAGESAINAIFAIMTLEMLVVAEKKQKNGRTASILIGAKFQSIHRFWSEILNFLRGAKNILQNMKMKRFIHGITEKRHGAHTTVK